MDDITRALLGGHEAAKRLTEQGVLLPCPFCGGEAKLKKIDNGYRTNPVTILNRWSVKCGNCFTETLAFESEIFQDIDGQVKVNKNGAEQARKAWNNRAAILTPEQIKRLEETD